MAQPLNTDDLSAQGYDLIPVTKNDSVPLPLPNKGLWVGTAGTATIAMDSGGVDRVNVPLLQGVFPFANVRLVKTGGTAADIWIILGK